MSTKPTNTTKEADRVVDAALDDFIKIIGNRIAEQDSAPSVINHDKAKLVLGIYNTLKRFCPKGAKITYKLNEPFRSMGSVSITGKNITFAKPELFASISKVASNVDIYPKTDGSIRVDFTFHGLTQQQD